ncbi:hypothetical protein N581_10535 [Lactobacillus jensenii MD IIE-70(2)]|nr:hypothetical protein N581_10535 [Lactobacillus jensenii MD IIE-70(2)]
MIEVLFIAYPRSGKAIFKTGGLFKKAKPVSVSEANEKIKLLPKSYLNINQKLLNLTLLRMKAEMKVILDLALILKFILMIMVFWI